MSAPLTRRDFLRMSAVTAFVAGSSGVLLSRAGGALFDDALRPTVAITDDLGRSVEIPSPSHLQRVYFSGPIGQVMLFTLKPELIAGTTIPFTRQELAFLPAGTDELPFMGSLSENGQIDIDQLHDADVQLVISASSDDQTIETLDDPDGFQEESGIPVICLKAGFDDMGQAYRKLGEIVGEEARAEEVASYLVGIFQRVTAAVNRVPVERRVRFYYAEGSEGLQTDPFNSSHAHTFGVAGAYNVAQVDKLSGRGETQVTISQVRNWDPEVIVAWDTEIRGGAADYIRSSKRWKGIRAVDEGRVYTMPNSPYSWCDRPAGPNRCLGIQWVANMLYPDYYDVDMIEVTEDFYRTMWRLDISDDQARGLLGNSYPVSR